MRLFREVTYHAKDIPRNRERKGPSATPTVRLEQSRTVSFSATRIFDRTAKYQIVPNCESKMGPLIMHILVPPFAGYPVRSSYSKVSIRKNIPGAHKSKHD